MGPTWVQFGHNALILPIWDPFAHAGWVLGPLKYSLHINDIILAIESKTRFFADDCLCYPEIKYMAVTSL